MTEGIRRNKQLLLLKGCGKLGAVHKRRPQSGGNLSRADIFRTRGRMFFRCGHPHF